MSEPTSFLSALSPWIQEYFTVLEDELMIRFQVPSDNPCDCILVQVTDFNRSWSIALTEDLIQRHCSELFHSYTISQFSNLLQTALDTCSFSFSSGILSIHYPIAKGVHVTGKFRLKRSDIALKQICLALYVKSRANEEPHLRHELENCQNQLKELHSINHAAIADHNGTKTPKAVLPNKRRKKTKAKGAVFVSKN